MKFQSLRILASKLLLVCLIQLFGGTTLANAEDTAIRIGVSLGLTGTFSEVGALQQRGYQLWETQINKRGGLLHRKVSVVIRDDRSDPDTAKKIYDDLILRERVEFIFGPYSSPSTAAVAPIADRHGYPMLAAGASADAIWNQGYKNVFGVFSPASRFPLGFLAILFEAGVQRIAVVSLDDVFSLGVAESIKKWAGEYSLRITSFIVAPINNPNLEQAAETSRRSGAQALLLAGRFDESVEMQKVLKRIGWKPVAYYATIGPALKEYFDQVGDDAEGTFSTSVWEPREDPRNPSSATFIQDFTDAYGKMPNYHAALAYAAGQILEKAIVKAGTLDRSAVRQAMVTLDANTILGRYAVDQTGLQIKRTPLVIQWQGKKKEIVWPPEARTKPAIIRSP